MMDQIPQFLQDKFLTRQAHATKFPLEIQQFMLAYSNYYDWNITDLKHIYSAMRNGVSEIGTCDYNDCNNKKTFNKSMKLSPGCCFKHSLKVNNLKKYGVESNMNTQESKDKFKQTNLERYGVEAPMQSKKIQQKSKDTCLEKYGVEYSLQDKNIRNKGKKTCLEKYGVEIFSASNEHKKEMSEFAKERHKNGFTEQQKEIFLERYGVKNPSQLDDVKEKKKQTTMNNYGVEHHMYSDEIKNMMIENSLKKYGVKYPFQNKEIYERWQQTMMDKYGVDHNMKLQSTIETRRKNNKEKYGVINVMQLESVFLKAQLSNFMRKEYKWNTGEISLLQGNEPIVLRELENDGYTFNDVLTDVVDMPEIWYIYNREKHRYYPDFYIPKENKIIEVKSEYTLNKEWDKNQAKFNATKELGYDFKLEVR